MRQRLDSAAIYVAAWAFDAVAMAALTKIWEFRAMRRFTRRR